MPDMIFFPMLEFGENPTRKRILILLNRAEHMTVTDISDEMGITPMAVRQHLISLEKKGIIRYISKRSGIGRPVFLYQLTDKAKEVFPKGYGNVLADILRIIEKIDGRRKVDTVFRRRKKLQLEEKRKVISKMRSNKKKVSALSAMLDRDGYMVEVEENRKSFLMKQYNCLLTGISAEFPEACKYELALYRDLLGMDVKRTHCQRNGDPSCTYIISKSRA